MRWLIKVGTFPLCFRRRSTKFGTSNSAPCRGGSAHGEHADYDAAQIGERVPFNDVSASVDLPRLTILTGPNGSGKSHLLQAIQGGAVRVWLSERDEDGKSRAYHEIPTGPMIARFDWNDMTQTGAPGDQQMAMQMEKQTVASILENVRREQPYTQALSDAAVQFEISEEHRSDLPRLMLISRSEAEAIPSNNPQGFADRLEEIGRKVEEQFGPYGLTDAHLRYLRRVSAEQRLPVIGLDMSKLQSSRVPIWGTVTIFQNAFARLFTTYRDLSLKNRLAKLEAAESKGQTPYLETTEFEEENGRAPWDIVNDVLDVADLDFEVTKPTLFDYEPYVPALMKRSTGATIGFTSLSSGEKVILALASCIFHSNDQRQAVNYPKVLLLDEIDAPLHPAMTRSMISTLADVLVRKYGMHVLLTTHSPSTVALAPEGSVFMMRSPLEGIKPTKRAEALNILTVGVPTLSITYEGRRQVLVESPADAETYGAVYNLLKSRLPAGRSLEFIAAGTEATGSGCDRMKGLLKSLVDGGVTSVFGVVDWDGKHRSGDRLAVLAEGRRDGIENVLFDPLLVACMVVRAAPQHKMQIGVPDTMSWFDFAQADVNTLGTTAARVAELVLGSTPTATTAVQYLGGMELQLDTGYFTKDDHTLERAVFDAFPGFNQVMKQRAGSRLQYVVNNVLADKPEFTPLELVDLLERLLTVEAHL